MLDKRLIKAIGWIALMAAGLVLTLLAGRFMDLQEVSGLKWMQLVQTFLVFLFPAWLAAWLWTRQPAAFLRLDKGCSWQTAVLAIVIMLVAIPGINLLSSWNQQLRLPEAWADIEALLKAQEEAAARLTEQFIQADNIGALLVNIGLMALLPAFAEECTFRGVLFQLLRGRSERTPHAAIWSVGIIFSLIHFQFYGFVPRMLLGTMFGYVLWWTGSLWVPVIMHFTNNAVAVAGYYITQHTALEEQVLEEFGTGDTLWVGLCSIATVCIGLATLYKINKIQ